MPALTRRGQGALIGGGIFAVVGAAYGVEEFVLFAIVAAVLLVFGALAVVARAHRATLGLRLTVHLPVLEVSVGSVTAGSLVLSNVGATATPAVVVDDVRRYWSLSHPGLAQPRLAGAVAAEASAAAVASRAGASPAAVRAIGVPRSARSTPVAGIAPGAQYTVAFAVPTSARGLADLAPVGVWCTDPFGLFAQQVGAGPPAHVMVCPVPDTLSDAATPIDEERAGRVRARGDATASRTRAGDEFSSLRPYVPGDRLTRLHWPALARTDTLVVREFVEPASGRLTLLVDLRPAAHSGGTAEAAISRAAGLGVRALDRGVSVELCTSSGEKLDVTAEMNARLTLLRAMALLAPGSAPVATTWRWSRQASGGAIWATSHIEAADVVLVTTGVGASNALPEVLRGRASTVVVS